MCIYSQSTISMRSKILLPLYIYPSPGAWDPLYQAISEYPSLDFIIIINPNSGPGAPPWWPNADYVREIPRLNACANVTLVGYVAATYCKRPLEGVFGDIQMYAARGTCVDGRAANLCVQGIFVDETVNLYEEEVKKWLDGVDAKIGAMEGITGERIVIHNPGTAVDGRLANPGPSITVIVETSYSHFMTAEYQEWLATSPYDRSRTAYMLHGVPEVKICSLTAVLTKRAAFLFLTSAQERFYEHFSSSWMNFVKAVAGA